MGGGFGLGELLVLLVFWSLFAVFSAALARSKGRSWFGWFLIGFFTGPFGLLVALFPALDKKNRGC